MDDNVDLREFLQSWPYDSDDDVRIIKAADGRELLQVRLPLGIEQYEMKGRPDGTRPYGKESVLQYYLERQAQAEQDKKPFTLTTEECAELFSEGTLYYYRYLHLFQAKEWEGTVRDTARNLQLFDLVREHAQDEDDQFYLEQWRPYLIRMHAAARAMLKLEDGQFAGALEVVRDAIASIDTLEELDDETFQFERDRSLAALRDMAQQIDDSKPVTELESLERELRSAIETQHFERAADLRDRIRALRDQPKS